MKKQWFLRTIEDWELEMVTGSKEDFLITTGHILEENNDNQTNQDIQNKDSKNNGDDD